MPETFRDTETAISRLTSGLQEDFPNAKADVVVLGKQLPATEACSIDSIGPVLEKVCKRFRSPRILYHPGNPYGFVAEVRGNGEESGERLRRHVIVLLTEINGEDIPAGQAPEGYRLADLDFTD